MTHDGRLELAIDPTLALAALAWYYCHACVRQIPFRRAGNLARGCSEARAVR